MRQNMNDITSIFDKIGYLNIFLTLASNPQWRETKRFLLSRQIVTSPPKGSAPVFCVELCALVAFVTSEKVFGEVKAPVRVIEFEKHGPPHAHCIFSITPQSKINLLNPTIIDIFISAGISYDQPSLLFQVAIKHSVDNPCGHLNLSTACKFDTFYSKYFPKDIVEKTGHKYAQM